MPIFKFTISDEQLAAFNAASAQSLMSANDWARALLVSNAVAAMAKVRQNTPQAVDEAPKLGKRTAAKYAVLKSNLAVNGRTVEQWATDRARDRLATQADHAHTARMLEIWRTEQGE